MAFRLRLSFGAVVGLLIVGVGLWAGGWFAPRGARAEGPGTGGSQIRLDEAAAGPYFIRVVSSPTPPRAGSVYVEIRVENSGGAVVSDVQVTVEARRVNGTTLVTSEANHQLALVSTGYAAHLALEEPGLWEVHILVDGAEGAGEAVFMMNVSGAPKLGMFYAVGLPLLGLAGLVVFFLRLKRQEQGTSN